MTETVAQTGILQSLGINGTLFLAQLINFTIVLLVLWRWAFTPLLKAMDARAKKIETGLRDAEEAKRLVAEADEKKAQVMKQAKSEAKAMLEQVKTEADEERARRTAETQAELDRQLEEARERLQQEKTSLMGALKTEAANLVVKATEKVTAGAMKASEHRDLIEQAIGEMNEH